MRTTMWQWTILQIISVALHLHLQLEKITHFSTAVDWCSAIVVDLLNPIGLASPKYETRISCLLPDSFAATNSMSSVLRFNTRRDRSARKRKLQMRKKMCTLRSRRQCCHKWIDPSTQNDRLQINHLLLGKRVRVPSVDYDNVNVNRNSM